jgi:N-carbamoyl-L-amino-acid hydrolase
LLSGTLPPGVDETLRDSEGQTLETLRRRAGFTGPLGGVRIPEGYYSAFVELHIEQGPILDDLLKREGLALGVVTDIAAPASFRIEIEGEGGHAGGRLMPGRRDALCAASEIILAVERLVLATGAIDTVGTVGICQVHPGAINSIPSRVQLTIDLRDTDAARRDGVLAAIREACDEIARRRNVAIRLETINADAPAQSAPEIVAALRSACETEGISYLNLVSRAYHDSLFLSRIAPVAMLFIPCRDGVSHRPDEYSSPETIERGVAVLARTLASLSSI